MSNEDNYIILRLNNRGLGNLLFKLAAGYVAKMSSKTKLYIKNHSIKTHHDTVQQDYYNIFFKHFDDNTDGKNLDVYKETKSTYVNTSSYGAWFPELVKKGDTLRSHYQY